MATTWREIWGSRRDDPKIESVCARLMQADGLGSGFSDLSEPSWRNYVRHTADEVGIQGKVRVFDVGCGSGAYLYPLYEQGCSVAGLDFSPALIAYAREAMPDGKWVLADAISLDPQPRYDFVSSGGAFHYFPSLEYAKEVLNRMARKAELAVSVLDVPDLNKRDEALAARRAAMNPGEYARKYAGLEHLYYSRRWFKEELASLGFPRVHFDEHVPGGVNFKYRFNVYAFRS